MMNSPLFTFIIVLASNVQVEQVVVVPSDHF